MQFFKPFIVAAVASLASAAITSELSVVSSQASMLSSMVTAFKVSDGTARKSGFLPVLLSYNNFSSAVVTLSLAGNSASGADLSSASTDLVSFFTQVTLLLDAFTNRARDFIHVGAWYLVNYDIGALIGPVSGFVSELVSIGENDCVLLSSFSAGMSSLSSAFSVAADTYGITDPALPTYACTGSGVGAAASGSSGSSATTTAASSIKSSPRSSSSLGSGATTSTIFGSSAPSTASSSAVSSSRSSSHSSNATAIASSSSSSVSSQNLAVAPTAVGAVAGVLGLAALLL